MTMTHAAGLNLLAEAMAFVRLEADRLDRREFAD